jgi:hypothetical protein
MADYVPPMPKGKTPLTDDNDTPSFPRITPAEKAEFAKGFGGKERTEKAKPKPKPRTASGRLEANLEELFSALALPFVLAGDTHCANIIAQGAPRMAESWVKLADENPGVKRVLTKLTESSAWGGVILSTAAVAVPIAAHHGMPMGPLGSILGGNSSPPRARSQRPSNPDASSMGAPVATKDPVAYPVAPDGYIPNDPLANSDTPPGVVTVGNRNRANGASAH